MASGSMTFVEPAEQGAAPGPVVLSVGADGGFATVSAALEAAMPGDTIRLAAGVYDEPLKITKPVTITGEPGAVVTSTWEVSASVEPTGEIHSGTEIKDLTFSNIWNPENNPHNAGFLWNAAGIITIPTGDAPGSISGIYIHSCTFTNSRQGVFLFGTNNALIEDCTFRDCYRGITIRDHYYSPRVTWASESNIIRNCNFYNMKLENGQEGEAIAVINSNYNSITDCRMDRNPVGVYIYRGQNNNIERNVISNSSLYPMYFREVVKGTLVKDNELLETGREVVFHLSRDFTFEGNTLDGVTLRLSNSTKGKVLSNTFKQTAYPALRIGTSDVHYDHTIATSNKILDSPIYYYYNVPSMSLRDVDAGAVYIAQCTKGLVADCRVIGGDGIVLFKSDGVTVENVRCTNNLLGITAQVSDNLTVTQSTIDTGTRGAYALLFDGSRGALVSHSTVRNPNGVDAFRLTGGVVATAHNTTFDPAGVNPIERGGGVLRVTNELRIRVYAEGGVDPFQGAEAMVTQDSVPMYATPYFDGTAPVTDRNGLIGPVTLLDREYRHSREATEHFHTVHTYARVDGTWSDSRPDIDMSASRTLVFTVEDIWAPGAPQNFRIYDHPDTDSIDMDWMAPAAVDISGYSLYSNMTGEWALLAQLGPADVSYQLTEGLVHGRTYYFRVSAWDVVPLEGPRTPARAVVHVDGVRPSTPKDLRAVNVTGSSCTLLWDPVADLDLEGYYVYINETGTGSAGPFSRMTTERGVRDPTFLARGLMSETSYYFMVTAIDEVPNESPDSRVLKVDIPDVTPPNRPVLDPLPSITNVPQLTVSGTAEARSTVMVFLGTEEAASTQAGDDKRFSVAIELAEGRNELTARAMDLVRNLGAPCDVVGIVLDTIMPDPPVLDPMAEMTNTPIILVAGSAEVGTTVLLYLDSADAGNVPVDADGRFIAEVELHEGENAITACARDAASNTGRMCPSALVALDTVAPAAPVLAALPNITNDPVLTVAGSAEPGSRVDVLNTDDVVARPVAGTDGSFSVDVELYEGENAIAARAIDIVFNFGPLTEEHIVVLDTVPPIAVAGRDVTAKEEVAVTLDGSRSRDNRGILSHVWAVGIPNATVTQTGERVEYTFLEPGAFDVTLTVTDLAGNKATDVLHVDVLTKNMPPTLSMGRVSPDPGDTEDKFTFTVVYKEPEGEGGAISLYLDGARYAMVADALDIDPSDGTTYTYTTKLAKGTHTFYFDGTDDYGLLALGPSVGEDSAQTLEVRSPRSGIPQAGAMLAVACLALVAVAVRLGHRGARGGR